MNEGGLNARVVQGERELADRESAVAVDDKLELKVWLRLLPCANLIEGEVRNKLRENFATTLPRFDLLAQLDRAPDGLSMGPRRHRRSAPQLSHRVRPLRTDPWCRARGSRAPHWCAWWHARSGT